MSLALILVSRNRCCLDSQKLLCGSRNVNTGESRIKRWSPAHCQTSLKYSIITYLRRKGILGCNSHLEVRLRSNYPTQNLSLNLKPGPQKVERPLTPHPPLHPIKRSKFNPPKALRTSPVLLYLTIPPGTLGRMSIRRGRVNRDARVSSRCAGLFEFNLAPTLSVRVAQVLEGSGLGGKRKQLMPRDLVGPGSRRQAVLFSGTHATTLGFCEILYKEAANWTIVFFILG